MSREPTPESSRTGAAFVLWLLAVAAGLPLRITSLLDDVPTLDEYHPLFAVSREGFRKLVSTFGLADRSIPVALYLELLTRTVGLSPIGLRLPFFLGGIATMFVIPFALRRQLGRIGAAALALLLALSPMLVYYSRAVRPYGIAATGLILAVLAHRRWLDSGSRRWLAAHVVLSAASIWALPVFAPFAAGAGLRAIVSGLVGQAGERVRRAVVAAALSGALTLALLGPALVLDRDSLAVRAGVIGLGDLAVGAALRVLAGTYETWIAIGLFGLALVAWIHLRRRAWVSDFAVSSGLQALAILVVLPLGVDEGRILARYLLPVWLVVLVLISSLASGPIRSSPRSAVARALVAVVLAFGVGASGPLSGWLRPGPDNFASDRLYQRLELDRRLPGRDRLSANYRRLSEFEPGAAVVLEVPFFVYLPRSILELQPAHRQPVRLAVTREFCSNRRRTMELPESGHLGFRLPWFVHLGDLPAIRRAGVRFVAFHRNQETRVENLAERHYFYDFERCVSAFERSTGLVGVDDGYVVFFDLDAGGPREPD